ncbi:hypothetical protein WMY93_015626 [Mugilogobius chulae]|uniref:RHD domain-containing protein n=1 Tax=Mugilogobius chulae TaxID=88201 RepID=A0AAW0NVA6_9GOBI
MKSAEEAVVGLAGLCLLTVVLFIRVDRQTTAAVPTLRRSARGTCVDSFSYTPNISLSLPLSAPCLPSQYHSLQSSPTISVTEAHQHHHNNHFDSPTQDELSRTYYSSPRPNGAPALESPRIEITAYSQFTEEEAEESALPVAKRVNSIVTLTLPNAEGYRDPSCLSPASSVSSRSCHSEASSYESSFSYNYENSPQNSPWQSPSVSPKGSTLTLPGDTHSPSGSPRTSITEDTWMGQRSRPNSPCGAKRKYSFNGSGTPHKFPYSPAHSPGPSPHASPRLSLTDETWLPNTNQYTNSAILAAINALTTDGMVDLTEGIPLKARKTSLDHSTSLSLKVEPVSEDMGHTELCPEERMKKEVGYGGGFLDIPQHPYSWTKPKTYIRIDCAGILKLRNSDIELRKGETDIGRKNTRVRMVFRVHINQSSGRTVSLQAASNPIECSQRSAQELPLVDKQSLETCPASGGLPLVLEGHNFQPDSKVMFVEKAQVPSIKTEPRDDFDGALVCPSLPLHPKPYFPPPALTPIILSGPGTTFSSPAAPPQRISPKPPASPSPTQPPPAPFSLPLPHVSIIQETPGRFATSPLSQPSTPSPESPFVPPAPSVSPLPLQPKDRPRDGDSSAPSQQVQVSIKQEPQELDQMYLDDGE